MDFKAACLALRCSVYFPNNQGFGTEAEQYPGTISANGPSGCPYTQGSGGGVGIVQRGRGGPFREAGIRLLNNFGDVGQQAFVNAGNFTKHNIGAAASWAGWLRINTTNGTHAIVINRGNSPDSFNTRTFTMYSSAGIPRMRIFRGANSFMAQGGTTIEVGRWYFLGGLYTQNVTVQIYVNGIFDGSATPSGGAINNPNTRSVLVGADASDSGSGVISDDYEVGPVAMWTGTNIGADAMRYLYMSGVRSRGYKWRH